jgi:hypothetical protein
VAPCLPARLRRSRGGARLLRLPSLAALAAVVVVLVLGAACAEDDPPPTSPLAEPPGATPVGASPALPGTPAPRSPSPPSLPRPTAPPALSTAAARGDADLENATARAIDLMAEWLGVAATDLRVERAEEVVWPSLCIGIERSGGLCGQSLTPGYLVRLLDRFDGVHALHMRWGGGTEWAGEERVQGAVVAVDIASALLEVEVRGFLTRFRLAPGSIRLTEDASAPALSDPAFLGTRVELAVDANPAGEGPAVVAWLADLP